MTVNALHAEGKDMYKASMTHKVMSINHLSARNDRFRRICVSCGNHSIGGEMCQECKKSGHPQRANHQRDAGEISNYATVPDIQRGPAQGQGAPPLVIASDVLPQNTTAGTQVE